MKIIVVAPFCSIPGEPYFNRFLYLAEILSESHQVFLITSSFNHFLKCQRSGAGEIFVSQNFTVVKLYEPGYSSNVSLGRILSHRIFCKNLELFLDSAEFLNVDVVYSAYPLLRTNLILSKFVKNNGSKLIIDVQDVWPESFASVFPPINWFGDSIIPFSARANRVYSAADALVAVSHTYMRRAQIPSPGVPSMVVYIGADCDLIDAVKASPLVDKFSLNFVYIGTLSYSYDVSTVIESFRDLVHYERYVFHIVGDGPQRSMLQRNAPSNVIFHGACSYRETISICKACDFAVNPIIKSARQSVTNKISDYICVGLPIISSQTNDEVIDLLNNYPSVQYESGVKSSFLRAIRAIELLPRDPDLMRPLRKLFDRELTYPALVKFIEDIADD